MQNDNSKNLEIINLLTPIFREVLDIEDLVLTPETSANDVDGWDSLAHIRLVVSIENELALRFTAEEVSSLKTIGDLAALVRRKQ